MTKDPRFKKIFTIDSVMMISAFRYALGRRIPIVSRTVNMTLTNWDKFTPNRIVEKQLEEFKNKRQYEQD